jgi:head-tail adaptor
VAQDARTATMTWRYRIRRRTDLTPAMRIQDGARLLNIQTVQDANKPGEMTLLAQEVIRG